MTVALLLGLVHAATDLATVTALVRATGLDADAPGTVFAWFLVYDVLAFGAQPLVGAVADRLLGVPVLATGVLLTGCSVAVASLGGGLGAAVTPATVVVAGLGNAVAHVGAGAVVLRRGLVRAAPAGLLVAPGALGLGLGLWFGRDAGLGPTWWVLVPLAAAAVLVVRLRRVGGLDGPVTVVRGPGERVLPPPGQVLGVAAGGLLLVSVAVRALVGASASRGYAGGAWLTVGVPVAVCAGKALGGVVADRVGWLTTTVGALAAALPLLAVRHDHPALLLVGLLVFQTTMPVTLVSVARLLPDRPGTAFGLPCVALLIGSLPATFSWGASMCTRPALAAWIVLSAATVGAGLRITGLRWRRRPPAGAADRVREAVAS